MIFFCIPGPDDQNRWNKKNCPKFFHRVIFAFWIQICNPNLCKSHTFWNTAGKWPFFCILTKIDEIGKIARNSIFSAYIFWPNIEKIAYPNLKSMKSKNCPKFFHRVIFAFWIQICNLNLCKSHIFWITANIEKWPFFAWWPKLMKKEKLREILSWGNFCVVNSNLQPKFM